MTSCGLMMDQSLPTEAEIMSEPTQDTMSNLHRRLVVSNTLKQARDNMYRSNQKEIINQTEKPLTEKEAIDAFKHIRYGKSIKVSKERYVKACERCNGAGSVTEEEMTDYHKREYATFRYKCKSCNGDGRIVCTKVSVEFDDETSESSMPISEFGKGDLHYSSTYYLRIRPDLNDENMNRLYPDLEDMKYENYDQLLEKYKTVEALKKE